MDTKITVAVIGAFATIAAALLPTLSRKWRIALGAIGAIVLLVTWLLHGILSSRTNHLTAHVTPFFTTPPVFTNENRNTVFCKMVIKILNTGDSDVVVKDIRAFSRDPDGTSSATSLPHPSVNRGLSLDDMLEGKEQFISYPFVIEAKAQPLIRVAFNFKLLDSAGKPLAFESYTRGYANLPSIMQRPNIDLILEGGQVVNVGTEEHRPLFVGQRIKLDPITSTEIWETELGMIYGRVQRLDNYGLYWKSRLRYTDESQKEKVKEWFNDIPWYEGSLRLEGGNKIFVFGDTVPIVTVTRYGSDPLRLYTVGIEEESNPILMRFLSKKNRLTGDKTISLSRVGDLNKSAAIWQLPKEEKGDENYTYILFHITTEPSVTEKGKSTYWPFKIRHIERLLTHKKSVDQLGGSEVHLDSGSGNDN